MRIVLSIALCACLLVFPGRPAVAAPSAQEMAQLGSLQRTAASLDDALDVYRLALVELTPALRTVLAAGQQQGAVPTTPLPAPTVEVFKRLSVSVHRRIAAPALPAVARAYHAEVVVALEDLAGAQSLGGVVAPARALGVALGHLAAMADDVVDVFSRQRPVLDEALDPGTALDDINEALQQLALAEANISSVRAHKGTQGEQLQAFLRLEIALGHALDLIAAAEESGIHIGFELPRSTVGLVRRLASVHKRLDELREVVAVLGREPRPAGTDMRAVVLPQNPARNHGASGTDIQLQWTPPEPGRQIAQVRLYRRNNLPQLRDRLISNLRCDGKSREEAEAAVADSLAGASDAPERLVELPPGRNMYTDSFKDPPAAPPLYRVVSVSAFGVEGRGSERSALLLPSSLAPPLLVQAKAQAPSADSAAFYRDADAVTVTWQASANDVSQEGSAMQFAEEHGLPVLMRYNVVRRQGGEAAGAPSVIGQVPAGLTQFVDRPPAGLLNRGVQYTVEAIDARGTLARAGGSCAQSTAVRLDLEGPLKLAQAGAMYVSHPTQLELHRAAALIDPAAMNTARALFLQLDPNTQAQWQRRFWYDTSAQKRVSWYQNWAALLNEDERVAWLAATVNAVHGRDEAWLHAEIWLADNAAVMTEVDRWWELLDEGSRRAALQNWRSHLNRAHVTWLLDRLKSVDERQRNDLERPARVLTWWSARDGEEQERLTRWWQDLPEATRTQRVAAWLHGQPRVVLQSIRWPDWEQLTAAERELWLRRGYEDLPSGLWPQLFAYMDWEQMGVDNKARAIAEEVGVWRSSISRLRFMIRPLDLLFDFKLIVALLVLGLGAAGGFLMRYATRNQLGDDPPDF